jgi:hypothetical protein
MTVRIKRISSLLTDVETRRYGLRVELRLRLSENTVLRRIFGHKSDEVTGEWSKLHNEELHNFNSSPNIIRQIKSGPAG